MKKNVLTPNSRKATFLNGGFVDSVPIYQKGDSTTTDITCADKMPDGRPIKVGYSKTEYREIPFPEHSASFNPAFPDARLRAMQLRANLNDSISHGNIYLDKFEAVKYANDSINALSKSIKNAKKS